MIDLLKEIDFSKEMEEDSELRPFLIEAVKKIEQEEADLLRKIKRPEFDEDLQNQFIVSGIPIIQPNAEDNFVKLVKTKLLDAKKIGEKNGLERIDLGKENAVGNQTMYMVYNTPEEAKVAFKKLNNLKFDKAHTLTCFTIREMQETLNFQQLYEEPKVIKNKEKIEYNLDGEHRNQLVIRQGNHVYLNWLDHLDKSALNALPTESMANESQINKLCFSPLGKYLAVCTIKGVFLYSGSELKFKGFYRQENTIEVKFSPDQRYMVSFNGTNMIKNRQNFIIWAVEEEIKLKSFKANSHQSLESFQFSENSKFLALILTNEVLFYTITLIEQFKQQLKASEEESNLLRAMHVQKVAWLQNNSVICLCYEIDYNPVNVAVTRVFIYNIQTKQERKWRAWSEHAKNGQIYVSSKGDWVAIWMKKFIKKNHFATVIQIGNLLKKDDPLEVTSVQVREEIGNISWDCTNNRFAVINEDQTTKKGINVRYSLTFYQITTKNKSLEINKLHEIKNNLQNRVILAKNGVFFALYNISEESPEKGKFSLGCIAKEQKEKEKGKKLTFQFTKHNLVVNGMSFFSMDSSGRFILLGNDKSYQIWNLIGECLVKDTLQKNISDVQWRPRLFNFLQNELEKKLYEDQKEIRKKYQEIDDRRNNELKYLKAEAKKKQRIEFFEFIKSKKEWFKPHRQVRASILGFEEEKARTAFYEIEEGFIDLE